MSAPIVVLETIEALREHVNAMKRKGRRVGFVPTMGYLHAGHLSLVTLAKQHSDDIIASIFVNPTQFNDPRDLEKYPRDVPRDLALLESVATQAVFLPTPSLMYGPQHESWVELQKLVLPLEGAHRPGHFRGVTTVVSMLFNLVQPDIAVFGEKDFQQLRIIERMVEDLKFPIQIVRGPLMREEDGLAMSSRNVRLDASARSKALNLSRGLFAARAAYAAGEQNGITLQAIARDIIEREGIVCEYLEVVREDSLEPCAKVSGACRILVAAVVGGIRLIDNVELRY